MAREEGATFLGWSKTVHEKPSRRINLAAETLGKIIFFRHRPRSLTRWRSKGTGTRAAFYSGR